MSSIDDLDPSGRIRELLPIVEGMACGDQARLAPISPAHDIIDALSHSINVLQDELRYMTSILETAKREAERANERKTIFLRNVSHELRTPVTAILTFADVIDALLSRGLGEREQRCLQKIRANAAALQRLIDDLLDIAKIEAGRLDIRRAPLWIRDLVTETVEDLAPSAQRKGIAIVVTFRDDVPARLVSDAGRIRQIISNLIDNAIKYTDRGEVRVEVSGPDEVVIQVADTGRGIAESERGDLFEPFARSSSSRDTRGTGLGLALTKQLAEKLDGELALVETAPGSGTTFRLRLPLVASADPSPASPAGHQPRSARVLLVEDDTDLVEAISGLIEILGYEVESVSDGLAAVERALSGSFDVVLMDRRMPGIDGFEATRRLRAAGYRRPIVALTALASSEEIEEARRSGFDEHLGKPFTREALLACITAHLGSPS